MLLLREPRTPRSSCLQGGAACFHYPLTVKGSGYDAQECQGRRELSGAEERELSGAQGDLGSGQSSELSRNRVPGLSVWAAALSDEELWKTALHEACQCSERGVDFFSTGGTLGSGDQGTHKPGQPEECAWLEKN